MPNRDRKIQQPPTTGSTAHQARFLQTSRIGQIGMLAGEQCAEASAMGAIRGRVFVERAGFSLDVYLNVRSGERTAIIGSNGTGKSTLIGAIAGTVACSDETTLTLGGEAMPEPEHRGIGYLSQDPLLFPHLNVLDNVAFGPRRRGRSKASAHRLAREALDRVGLAHLEKRHSRELSGGERQRVAFARVLASEPRILLLDEPFAGLDVNAAAHLRELIRSVAEANRLTLLLISHDLVDVVSLCDNVMELDDGRVVQMTSVHALRSRPATEFAASFAGVVRIPGVYRDQAFYADSGLVLRSSQFEVCAEPLRPAYLCCGPHEVDANPAVDVNEPGCEDRAISMVGSGTSLVTKLASGLMTAEAVPPGTTVQVYVRSARILPQD